MIALLSLAAVFARAQDEPKPPKDSVQLVVTGCLEKKVLDASKIEPEDLNVPVHTFSLSGKKDVMAEVKSRNKQRVAVTGWVRKIDLTEPGLKVGRSGVIIGPASSSDPMRPQYSDQMRRIITMEALKVDPVGNDCTHK